MYNAGTRPAVNAREEYLRARPLRFYLHIRRPKCRRAMFGMNDCFVVTSRIVNRVCATSGKNDTIHAMDEVPKKPVRLTRAGRTAILKALADPRRFELLERIAAASCP